MPAQWDYDTPWQSDYDTKNFLLKLEIASR